MFALRPARKVPPNWVLFTRKGLKIKVFRADAYWIEGTIKGKDYHWFDTGNFIGSDCPHSLDVDWKHSWDNYKRWKRRKEKSNT